jgi:hypothetical protein
MLKNILAELKLKKFEVFKRPYELNIVGQRGKSTIPNRFDDELHVFYKINSKDWQYHVFKITTDPGTFWLENPMNPQGTALVAEGQFKNSHAIGLHKGQYKALVQVKPLTVIRKYDRKAKLDFYNGKKQTGIYGIDIHRANKVGTTKTVDKNSAGCQVFENASDFAAFMQLCEKHRSLYGNQFTYTLFDYRTWQRAKRRVIAYYAGGFIVAGIAGYFYVKHQDKKEKKEQQKQIE